MSLSLVDIERTTPEVWQTFWTNCSWATVSESPEWARLWQQTFGRSHIPSPWLITYSDGFQLVVATVSVTRSKNWFEVQLAGPSGGYGGPLAHTLPSLHHLSLLLEHFTKRFRDYHLRLNPFLLKELSAPDMHPDIEETVTWEKVLPKPIHPDYTQPVPLDHQTDALLSAKRVRRYANAAAGKGYQIRPMDAAELPSYLQIYRQAQQRWDSTTVVYPDTFFENMMRLKSCRFFGVYDEDGIYCGGGPMLVGNSVVTTWLSIMDSNRLRDHIYELFYYTLIHQFRKEGYHWFDFNPSGGQAGVVRFKSKFTPLKFPAPMYEEYSWKRLLLITLGR